MQLVFEILIWAFKAIILIIIAIAETIRRFAESLLSITGTDQKSAVGRGEIFTRAYFFLELLDTNVCVDANEANSLALQLFHPSSDIDADQKVILRAIEYAKQNYEGRQLPVIHAAEARGFIGA